jgi:lysine 2,3-aminomutase
MAGISTRRAPVRTLAELAALGLVPAADLAALAPVAARYAIRLTPAVAAKIAHSYDPLGRQFLPSPAELATSPEENPDPIGDAVHSPVKGIVHRYHDRVLLKPLHICPVYCRFCFRREVVGPGGESLTAPEINAALAYIAGQPQLREVILTGGDPLMLAPAKLGALLRRLAEIAHIERLRLHSRVPVVDPERVTPALLASLRQAKPVRMAIHCNHASELDSAAYTALAAIGDAGVGLLSQTVLLKGVNDSAETLSELWRALAVAGVAPYYLHHPDLAPGTGTFRLTIAQGSAIYLALGEVHAPAELPRYVLDIPGGFGKVPLAPPHLEGPDGQGRYRLRDRHGNWHLYPPPPVAPQQTGC